ncbi:class I SAM-dependent methyltransferase [Halomarina oriensis]|uniref:Methyltransferase domain-containing protein n=1 Tax=Halomarina oriensis TaxID=671145 RepID=A0A6B0GPN4_9EURY|nr:class I SAM-dependent methyltransferase [Halomarina oriensis]MWG34055.1 methyltransferase domain-containing protein [Halomarina oriensis]
MSHQTDRPAKSPDELQFIYADAAETFERFAALNERLLGRYRERLFARAQGHVLDVACGTGSNLQHLPEGCSVVGVDLSTPMLEGARREAASLGREVTLAHADAQRLPFADDAFDTVVSALSTCTFPDPVAALREMARVCAPAGRILLFEHGRSSLGPVAWGQDRLAPWHFEDMGCRWNQDPEGVVREAGLEIRRAECHVAGVFTSLVAGPTVVGE